MQVQHNTIQDELLNRLKIQTKMDEKIVTIKKFTGANKIGTRAFQILKCSKKDSSYNFQTNPY